MAYRRKLRIGLTGSSQNLRQSGPVLQERGSSWGRRIPRPARRCLASQSDNHFGKGKLSLHGPEAGGWRVRRFSNLRHCADCDSNTPSRRPPCSASTTPWALARPARVSADMITIDYDRAIPDRTLALAAGAVNRGGTGSAQSARAIAEVLPCTGYRNGCAVS